MTKHLEAAGVQKRKVRLLMIFFALLYLAEGLGQQTGLLDQPITYFLKSVYGWRPDQVAAYISMLMIPWIIKPIYGLISDFFPLAGYRRKTWLLTANLLAVGGYIWMSGLADPDIIIVSLTITAVGMASASALCGAVMVENGKKYALSDKFVNQEWLWYYFGTMCACFAGGWLTQKLSPAGAFHTAALVVAAATTLVMVTFWFLVEEDRAPELSRHELKRSLSALAESFKARVLWWLALFLFLYYFSPGLGKPLYFHLTDKMHFSQQFIGILSGISAGGSVAGAFVFNWLDRRLNLKQLLVLSIALGVMAQLSYLLLQGEASAVAIYFVHGIVNMVTLVTALTLAADFCPDGSEGFAYATMMAFTNVGLMFSEYTGAKMYVGLFNYHLAPLIVVSAACTALALPLLPKLKLGDKRAGEKAELG